MVYDIGFSDEYIAKLFSFLLIKTLVFLFFKDYGMEGGAFCGVFDGHGKNGHVVSNMVRNRLPSLLLSQKNALAKIKTVADDKNFQDQVAKTDGGSKPSKDFLKWKKACISAFKVMDKEIKLQEKLDCSTSGTTAVVVVRQVRKLASVVI